MSCGVKWLNELVLSFHKVLFCLALSTDYTVVNPFRHAQDARWGCYRHAIWDGHYINRGKSQEGMFYTILEAGYLSKVTRIIFSWYIILNLYFTIVFDSHTFLPLWKLKSTTVLWICEMLYQKIQGICVHIFQKKFVQ